jgi:hypothetical protein
MRDTSSHASVLPTTVGHMDAATVTVRPLRGYAFTRCARSVSVWGSNARGGTHRLDPEG